MTTTKRNTKTAPVTKQAPAPATQQADQAAKVAHTKYTRRVTEETVVAGVDRSNALTLAQLTENGKMVFKPNTGTFKAGPTPKMGPKTYKAAMYNALKDKPFAEAVAAAVVACANQPGAVPGQYSESYMLTAAWLEGKGPKPDKSQLVNCGKHMQDYIRGWMLKSKHGGMTLS